MILNPRSQRAGRRKIKCSLSGRNLALDVPVPLPERQELVTTRPRHALAPSFDQERADGAPGSGLVELSAEWLPECISGRG